MTITPRSSDYFAVTRVTPLRKVSPHGRIHIIGVGGVAMAQLAVALSESGYEVSGSDKQLYEPMKSFLAASRVRVFPQYSPENIADDIELVIVGNVVSYGHPEVIAVEEKRMPFSLFPRCLHELIIEGRHSVVVSGTHGKSTTTGLMAVALRHLGADPSFFVGASLQGVDRSLHAGSGPVSVVEGDEYDSAFFAKVPKFSFYVPNSLIVTAIEFDHADIYASLEQIEQEFTKLILSMGKQGLVACCIDDENVRRLVPFWRSKPNAPTIVTYGELGEAEVRLVGSREEAGRQSVTLQRSGSVNSIEISLQLAGLHNARNAAAAFVVLSHLGYPVDRVIEALGSYRGARRRQEVKFASDRVILVDDFAHHPTAVRETLKAIRARYPGRRVRAVFEPRSNTSRKRVFQSAYVEAFHLADQVVLAQVTPSVHDVADDLLNVDELGAAIAARGTSVRVLPDAPTIAEELLRSGKENDLILVMSNGGFGGLVSLLADGLQSASAGLSPAH